MKARIWYNLALRIARESIAVLVGAVTLTAAAYLPPVAERDGVAVRIAGFDEMTGSPGLHVVTRNPDEPMSIQIVLENRRAEAVSGQVKAWLNDDWEVMGMPAGDVVLRPFSTNTVSVTARARPGRVLPALYPVHATYAIPGGEPLHPIAIFRAEPKARPSAPAPATTRVTRGVTRLTQLLGTSWVEVKGRVAPLESGQTGAHFSPCVHTADGVAKHGFSCHPPWQGGVGVEWRDIPLELPEGLPCQLHFSMSLERHSAKEPPSDGTEYKVFVLEGGRTNCVFSRVNKSFSWQDARVDLSPWAGKSITLRLWIGPGPAMDTTCDRCVWGNPRICSGTFPAPPTEDEWAVREEAAVAAAKEAIASGTDAAHARFRLSARGETWGAAWAFGKLGAFDGVLSFTDGARTLSYRGFACEVEETSVGTESESSPCTGAEVRTADGDAAEVVHSIELGGRTVPLRLRMWPEQGALRMRWDMPGTVRDQRGHPRYTRLGLGNCSLPAWRAYAGFGNVVENPNRFSLEANGFDLSTRHAGGDYGNGASLLQATDVFPDRLVCRRDRKRYSLEAHHDATFTLIPSARGAFAAARHFRDVCGYRRSPSWREAATRMCIDQWNGNYEEAARDLAGAGKYGLNESIFVKHEWQRWGYDYRLPEIHPPSGDMAAFMAMRATAKEAGILFCPHDNYIDFYPDAAGYSYDHIAFNRDRTPTQAWYNSGRRAQSYRWAPHAFMPWLKENSATLREAFAPDAIFIDVFTAIAPFDYYDRAGRFHPKTRTQEEWGRAFDTYRTHLVGPGVTVSEAGTDALVGHLDAGQSDHFGAERWMRTDEFGDSDRTPWHDMATHGTFVLFAGGLGARYCARSWSEGGDARLHGYGSDDYLCNTVIGGRAPMCDGPLRRRTVMTYWLLHDVCKSLALADFESLEYGDTIHRQHSRFSNGGEVWINRATNGVEWTVNGHVLPTYGFYAKAPGVSAGVVRIDGQRCAFAAAQGCLFVDARPPHDDGLPRKAAARVVKAEIVGPSHCRIETEWTLREPVKGYHPFVHVVPADGGETPILFQCAIGLEKSMMATAGTHAATIDVLLPNDLPAGQYDVRFGAFRPSDGSRMDIRGMNDGTRRIKGGRLKAEKQDGRFTRLAWSLPVDGDDMLELNKSGRLVPFAGVKTDGAFRIEHSTSGDWRLTPLPGSKPFRAIVDLSALGAANGAVSSVTAIDADPDAQPVAWRQLGQTLDIRADARAFAYRIAFKKP